MTEEAVEFLAGVPGRPNRHRPEAGTSRRSPAVAHGATPAPAYEPAFPVAGEEFL